MQGQTAPVAIVTGSSKGIGLGIASALAAAGTTVVVTSRQADRAEAVAQTLAGNAIGLAFDIEDGTHPGRLIEQTLARCGRLDILVNNAISQACLVPSADYDDATALATINANLGHTYLLCRRAFPHLRARRGCVLNIGSVVVNRHLQGLPLYGMVKGSIVHMTRVLAAEWAEAGVRVNAINPGFIRTQAFVDLGLPPDLIDRAYGFYAGYQPLGGVGKVDAVAGVAAFLCSPAAGFVTGAVMEADGGYSIRPLSLYSE